MEAFHNTWNLVISELSIEPEPSLLQHWYFEQTKNFKPMSDDIAHYRRVKFEPGNPVCSFEWLWAASCRYLLIKREDYMQQASTEALPAHLKVPQAPMPPPKVAEGKA